MKMFETTWLLIWTFSSHHFSYKNNFGVIGGKYSKHCSLFLLLLLYIYQAKFSYFSNTYHKLKMLTMNVACFICCIDSVVDSTPLQNIVFFQFEHVNNKWNSIPLPSIQSVLWCFRIRVNERETLLLKSITQQGIRSSVFLYCVDF